MDVQVQLAIVSTVGTLALAGITILGTVINSKLNKADKERAEIKMQTNGALSAANQRLEQAQQHIRELHSQLAAQQEKFRGELVAEMRAPTTVPVTQAIKEVSAALLPHDDHKS